MAGRKVSVLVPVQEGTGSYLDVCVAHLFEALPEETEVFVVYSADFDDRADALCKRWIQRGLKSVKYPAPASAVELCRWAYESIPIRCADVLILHPGVAILPDTVREASGVLEIHERHAIAVPRSNQAGIPGIPVTGPELSPERSHQIWKTLKSRMLRYQTISYADTGCMLIRRETLEHFGLFASDATVPAYSERINRYGYSTVLANRSFVEVSPEFCLPAEAEDLPRYFELEVDPVDYFAALAIPHRPRILVDLYHLAPRYYGTSEFALNLLRELHQQATDIELYIDIQPASFEFFLPELQGYRLYREDSQSQLFDLVFKPTQINSWDELARINRVAPRVAYTILDMIAVRCDYLSAPGRRVLFRTAAELCDLVFTLSHSAKADFTALTNSNVDLNVIPLGTNYGVSSHEFIDGTYVLIMGNAYTHKGVGEALAALEGETYPIAVLGGSAPDSGAAAGSIRYLESGGVSRAEIRATLAGARVLVYPSHYEGFGLPVLDALALKKQVIVLDNGTNREMAQLAASDCLRRISSMRELKEAVRKALSSNADCHINPRRWHSVASDYVTSFRELLSKDVDDEFLRARWNFLRAQRA